jgi:hypothetical protein
MFSDDTRQKLENIVRGIVLEGAADNCTAARNLLCASFSTSTTVKKDFESQSIVKKEQVVSLMTSLPHCTGIATTFHRHSVDKA